MRVPSIVMCDGAVVVAGDGRGCCRGFTVVELLTGMTVFAVILGLLLTAINQTSNIWQKTKNEVGSFQSARFAFSLITQTLSQATLNTYIDYDNAGAPTRYIRKSDLNFVVDVPPGEPSFGQGNAIFFQAKLGKSGTSGRYDGMEGLLNAVGYYVTYGQSPNLPGFLVPFDKYRFQLRQYLQPSEKLAVFNTSDPITTDKHWFADPDGESTVIADNVILLLFWPKLARQEDASGALLTNNYLYDSRPRSAGGAQVVTDHQQPPMVQVTLVAIDEISAARLGNPPVPPTVITDLLRGRFQNVASYEEDLAALESGLAGAKIQYRVFNSTVSLLESKWTKQ